MPLTHRRFLSQQVLQSPVLEIQNLPQAYGAGSNFLAWTDSSLYRVSGDTIFNVNYNPFITGSDYARWGIAAYYSGFWFANKYNALQFTNGSIVNSFISPNTRPTAEYVENFYDYIVVGRPTWNGIYYPYRVQWCDLRNPDVWIPDPTNSADFYDLVNEDELSQFSYGLTGLKKITAGTTYRQRDYLIVYTPREIRRIQYVGEKLVMQMHTSNDEIGCAFPWSVTGYSKLHAFIGEENFYSFDGFEPKIIGDPVKDYFFNDVSSNGDWRYRTYGEINKDKSELWWIYISKAQTDFPIFDKAIIWNFREDQWSVASVENYHSFRQVATTSALPVINTHTEIINTDNIIINDLDKPTDFGKQFVYGTTNNVLLRDATLDDTPDVVIAAPAPFLVTKDLTYEDLQHIKEIDQIVIHADYDEASCVGVSVSVSARNELEDPVEYFTYSKLWTKNMKQKRYTLAPPVYGRVFRFKLTWIPAANFDAVRGAVFYGWGENTFLKDPEGKPLQIVA